MADETEVLAEVEAVRAVYGDDCRVLRKLPPHLAVHMRPRTADVSFQQFVEAVIGLEAGPKYPEEVPCITIIDSKGLDEQRQGYLIAGIRAKAQELSSYFMLVALCEEAVEILSNMNHPAGNCPLCLDPLFPEDKADGAVPYMKLMSCYHCFHSECIVRWWQWLQEQSSSDLCCALGSSIPQAQRGVHFSAGQQLGNCPVCRQKFDKKDIEHVLSFMKTNSLLNLERESVPHDWEAFNQSDEENFRRQKYESVLKIQKENGGLIEPPKIKAVVPGMFLPESMGLPIDSLSINDQTQHAATDILLASTAPETSAKASGNTVKNVDPRRNRGHHHHPRNHQNHRRKDRNAQTSCKWIQKENNIPHK